MYLFLQIFHRYECHSEEMDERSEALTKTQLDELHSQIAFYTFCTLFCIIESNLEFFSQIF